MVKATKTTSLISRLLDIERHLRGEGFPSAGDDIHEAIQSLQRGSVSPEMVEELKRVHH